MRKMIASTAAAASILGATAGLAFVPTIAGAQDVAPQVEETTGEATSMTSVLDGLVEDGTLTQVQRDAVETALSDARPDGFRHGSRGHHRGGAGFKPEVLEELGLDAQTVREGLIAGSTLGEIAEANGSSVEALTDALIEGFEERLDAAVEAGRIDAETADEKRAEIETRVDDIVSGEAEFGRRGFGGRGRFGGPDASAEPADA
jgi:hypothetical protein